LPSKTKKHNLKGIVFFLIFLVISYNLIGQKIQNSVCLGNYQWVKSDKQKSPSLLSTSVEKQKTIVTKHELVSFNLFEREIITSKITFSNKIAHPKIQSIQFKKTRIKPSKIVKASNFFFKDKISSNITYSDFNHDFVSNAVISITEDDEHNIWFATEVGLIKYDGVNYFIFDKAGGLPSITFKKIIFVPKSGVWAATEEGFYKINNEVLHTPIVKASFQCLNLSLIKNNTLYISTNKHGFLKINTEKENYQLYNTSCGLPTNMIRDVQCDYSGNLWISTFEKGVLTMDKNRTLTQLFSKCNTTLVNNTFNEIFIDSQAIWLGGAFNGLVKIENGKYTNFSYNGSFNESIYEIISDKNLILFSLYGYGVLEFNKKSNSFQLLQQSNGLTHNGTYSMHKDSYGNIWVGDLFRGVSRMNNRSLSVENNNPLLVNLNNRIEVDDTTIWVFQNGGQLLNIKGKVTYAYTNSGDLKTPQIRHIMDGVLNTNGSLWVGFYASGIGYITDSIFQIYSFSDSDEDKVVLGVKKDQNNNIWFRTMQFGLIKYNPSQGKFYQFSTNSGLLNNRTNVLFNDKQNAILIGYENGIQKIKQNEIYDLKVNSKTFNINCQTIYNAKYSPTTFIGTLSKGLFFLKKNKLYNINTAHGLLSNKIHSIIEDKYGNLWISTDQGIQQLKIKGTEFILIKTFGKQFGVYVTQTTGGVFLDSKGFPIWAISGSLLNYDSTRELNHSTKPIIQLKDRYINGTKIKNSKQTVTIAMNEILKINYVFKYWGNEDYTTHYYILKSKTTQNVFKTQIQNHGTIKIQNINPDEYELYLVFEHNGKAFRSNSIHFTFLPPWYKTYTFNIILALIILLIICVIFIYKNRITLKRNRFLEAQIAKHTQELVLEKIDLEQKNETIFKQNQIKDDLIQEIHHRVKNNLQFINSLIGLQISNSKNEKELTTLLDTSRRILAIATVHEMLYNINETNNISIFSYINNLTNTLNELINTNNLPIIFEEKLLEIELDVNQCASIGMILSELVSNSIKYAFKNTPNPSITISLKRINHQLQLEYTDNGSGFDSTDPNLGIGLGSRLINIFSRQLEGEYQINSKNGYHYKLIFNL
jgi:two-component sensor histidine kinase/ligand-binding sensor domain-containing protein